MTAPETQGPTVTLLPCPFCGHQPFKRQIANDGRWAIDCQTANCVRPGTDLCRDEQKAVAAWNTRTAAEAASRQEVGALLDALGPFIRDWHDAGVPESIDGKRAMIAVDDGHGMTVGEWRTLVAAYEATRAALSPADGGE